MQLKIDLHVHSVYSGDSSITLESIPQSVVRAGLNGIAVTDHDNVEAFRQLQGKLGFIVIPGVEVTSRDGHILGLGVNSSIERGLSAQETVEAIHNCGGLAVAAHPLNLLKNSMKMNILKQIKLDAIETFNASTLQIFKTDKLEKFAVQMAIPCTGGSDAHTPSSIGRGYTIVESEGLSMENIMDAIRKGKTAADGEYITLKDIFFRVLLKAEKFKGKKL